MRPIPLHNPWPERRRKLLMAFFLTVVAITSTRPNSLIGLAIALVTIPPLCLILLSLNWWWRRKFGGSKFMALISLILVISAWLAIDAIADMLSPYIGQYFG
ncbi:DUF389 domain-containing protein [Pseudomonas sp. LRF_L74]|uniref:DUF389 domain-containing protein n=1 Tax=Pseudomonas sp. LRF_L74 TaxID=3369422 RepID=UPI003F5F88CC